MVKLDEELQDNVSLPSAAPAQTFENSASYNIMQAANAIAKHYSRSFKNLRFVAPNQFVDGGVVEYLDGDLNCVIATARLRMRNRVSVNEKTGTISVEVDLTDLSYGKPTIDISVNNSI